MSAVDDERPIRRAASIVCVREGAHGEPEVLVVERSAASRFLPGYVAFPGGAVDGEDEMHAERWFGDGSQAARAAAVRELVEEVGLTLTVTGLVPAHDMTSTDATPPAIDQLSPLCHWVAPPEVPVRFDARYFTVAAQANVVPVPDDAEVAASWWTSPRRLLAEWAEGGRKLYWPTWLTVTALAGCASVHDVLALRLETREPTPAEEATMPRHVMEQV
jgi:8-oxo-dGTP pyrophosphatase MutT (NUDIX family)